MILENYTKSAISLILISLILTGCINPICIKNCGLDSKIAKENPKPTPTPTPIPRGDVKK